MGLFDNLFGNNKPPKITIGGIQYEIDANSAAYSKIGIDKYNKEDYRGAIIAFTEALKTSPNNQNIYTWRGTAYEDISNDIEAEKDFRKAISINQDFLSMYRYGMLKFRMDRLDEAISWMQKSYNSFPTLISKDIGMGSNNILYVGKQIICANLGSFLLQADKLDESLKFSLEAVNIDPKYPNPLVNVGVALYRKGSIKEAIPFVEKAVNLGYSKAASVLQAMKQELVKDDSIKPSRISFVFKSSDHVRMQDGNIVSGPHGGAPRAIKVEPNEDTDGYIVTIFNLEGPHPVWQNNVQMAPKQMKVIHRDEESIVLRGYGYDAVGASFADYGLTIHLSGDRIAGCSLSMLDRGVDISYYP